MNATDIKINKVKHGYDFTYVSDYGKKYVAKYKGVSMKVFFVPNSLYEGLTRNILNNGLTIEYDF